MFEVLIVKKGLKMAIRLNNNIEICLDIDGDIEIEISDNDLYNYHYIDTLENLEELRKMVDEAIKRKRG